GPARPRGGVPEGGGCGRSLRRHVADQPLTTQIVLLRGINIGSRNRVPMAKLREALEEAGFGDVLTHLQSGNVVLSSNTKPEQPEQLVVSGREIYAWHPKGVARSKLWAALAGRGLGVTATARNWTTVKKLLEMTAK